MMGLLAVLSGCSSDDSTAEPPPAEGQEQDGGNDALDTEVSSNTPAELSKLGEAVMVGSGVSSERYHEVDVTRDGQNYRLMTNGWGPGFEEQTISYNGTSFTVESMAGEQGDNYEPATYPTIFCGAYSSQVSQECGLPAAFGDLASLRTGWRWKANGNDGEYNAAYDIWLSSSNNREDFTGFMMVWLREPAGQQPAGQWEARDIEVENVPGKWHIWEGTVFGTRPIVNWVRAEGNDTEELEFDILDFVRDAEKRGMTLPGTHVLSVAVGFEIWNGPVTNLQSLDFYVDPQF